MLYVRRECTDCVVPDVPIQAPIHLYTKMAVMNRSMQTYIIFYHVMKTLYTSHTRHVHDCITYLSAFRFYCNVLTSEQLNSKICGHGFVLKEDEQPVLGNVLKKGV